MNLINLALTNTAAKKYKLKGEVDHEKNSNNYFNRGINDETVYVVEDISGASVSKYHYEVNFLPEMINPITFTSKD